MELPKRKHPRLKHYDYSQSGYYFATIQTKTACPPLSTVGWALEGEPATAALSPHGEILREQLFTMETRFPNVKVESYVIMPDHVHVLLAFKDVPSGGTAIAPESRPTLSAVIGAWKSLSTRLCNQRDLTPGRTIFQVSFFERVIRNEAGYLAVCKYIEENPAKWLESGKEPELNI